MKTSGPPPKSIDAYLALLPPKVRATMQKIRTTARRIAPQSVELISYRMPALKLQGRILIYFAAFRQHIGIFPPLRADAALMREVRPYANPKGNLRFPLSRPFPFALLARIVRARLKIASDQAAKKKRAAGKAKPRRPRTGRRGSGGAR